MATVEVTIPDIGDFDEVAVIELLVKEGDKVRTEQSLITVESDKASMEIPSSHAGVVKEIRVKLGDKALYNGQTVTVPRTQIEVDDQAERRLGVLRSGVTLQELVRGLNSLGVGPRELITILQSIKAAGALQAELEVR